MTQTKEKGFTLVELLVVIAIIGLLSTLAIVALGSARSKARDARRISDIKQIQTALELYFADQGIYPVVASATTLGTADTTDILTEVAAGFEDGSTPTGTVTYMGQVPSNFAAPSSIADYEYTTVTAGTSYTLTFELEGTVSGLTGAVTASPSGLSN
jgi:prepilin-type N-terminal cleavage/methylation domain-containing protein